MTQIINYNFFHWGPFLYKTSLTQEEIAKVGTFLIGITNEDRESYKDPTDLEYKSLVIKNISSYKYYN